MKSIFDRIRDLREQMVRVRDRYSGREQHMVDMSDPDNHRIVYADTMLHGPVAVCLQAIGGLYQILHAFQREGAFPERGLYEKFLVVRRDGSSDEGQKHERCDYFVIDWVHDKYAPVAVRAYADACSLENPELARDLRVRAAVAERAL